MKFNNLFFCIMHSKIFQITQKRVEKDCYLNEDTLMQGAGSFLTIAEKLMRRNVSYILKIW